VCGCSADLEVGTRCRAEQRSARPSAAGPYTCRRQGQRYQRPSSASDLLVRSAAFPCGACARHFCGGAVLRPSGFSQKWVSPIAQRCYNPSVRIPTARVRELRGSPTEAEKAAWNLLRGRRLGAKFRRQFPVQTGVLDFYCFEHRLAIELDGGVHSQIDQMRRDAAKEDYLRSLGIRVLRIPNAMVLEHPEEFVRKVVEAMGTVAERAKK